MNCHVTDPFVESAPPLQRLIIYIPSGIHYDIGPSISKLLFHQLRHLTLSNCPCVQLQEIFRRAPRLLSLNISFTFSDPDEIDRLANFHQGQSIGLIFLTMTITAYGE